MNKLSKYKDIVNRFDIVTKIENSYIVKKLTPKGENYNKSRDNLKKIGIKSSVEMIIFYKNIVFVSIAFTLLILSNIYYTNQKRKDFIYGIDVNTSNIMNMGVSNENKNGDVEKQILIKFVESQPNYRKLIKQGNQLKIYKDIKNIEKSLDIDDFNDNISKRILKKIYELYEIQIKPLDLVLMLLISILMSELVNAFIKIKLMLIESKIDKEVNLIELLTSILMENNNISIEQILKKQRNYAKVLKPYYTKCLKIYPKDPNKALEILKEGVNNVDFNKFMYLMESTLVTDRETNIQLINAHKLLQDKITQERAIRKNNRRSTIFTFLSFPLLIGSFFILLIPITYYVYTGLR